MLTNPTSTLLCIDTFHSPATHLSSDQVEGAEARFRRNLAKYISNGQVLVRKGTSLTVLSKLVSDPSTHGTYDHIYIDGSHTAYDTLADAILSFTLLKRGGVITFDDYGWTGSQVPQECPKLGIDSFLNVYAGQYEVIYKGYQLKIKKK